MKSGKLLTALCYSLALSMDRSCEAVYVRHCNCDSNHAAPLCLLWQIHHAYIPAEQAGAAPFVLNLSSVGGKRKHYPREWADGFASNELL